MRSAKAQPGGAPGLTVGCIEVLKPPGSPEVFLVLCIIPVPVFERIFRVKFLYERR
jgi:uncharacterized membrane protein YcfT